MPVLARRASTEHTAEPTPAPKKTTIHRGSRRRRLPHNAPLHAVASTLLAPAAPMVLALPTASPPRDPHSFFPHSTLPSVPVPNTSATSPRTSRSRKRSVSPSPAKDSREPVQRVCVCVYTVDLEDSFTPPGTPNFLGTAIWFATPQNQFQPSAEAISTPIDPVSFAFVILGCCLSMT